MMNKEFQKAIPNDAAIYIENVGVRYRGPSEQYASFKDYAIHWIQGKVKHGEFWALHNVNVCVNKGEIFGVIGNNGAGKSTMLKLIARVLQPTRGRVVIRGRVAPLLELGAGFHPELSGRENVFLNGAILGYSYKEIEGMFDRIVDFAELHQFIDAPIRTYSSGMMARLGFSVATARRSEVLLVDEILAVGDEAFQHKSIHRIEQFREEGSTVVMVSHYMQVIEALCHRVAWLDHGQLKMVGEPSAVIQAYREHQNQHQEVEKAV